MYKKYLIIILLSTIYSIYANQWNVYIDADFSGAKQSAESIKMGIELSLKRYLPKEFKINIIIRNHRGNSLRSLKHLEEINSDSRALAVYCGLHSPPVLANLEYINRNSILLLNPWAAATPITRSPDKEAKNWAFRVSVDDKKAGEVITSYAIDKEGFKKPILLLEDTGWGKANEITFKEALNSRSIESAPTLWFDWKVGNLGIKKIVSDIINHKADVVFLVANAPEGKAILEEIALSKHNIPVRSHWGITGGDTFDYLKEYLKNKTLDLKFIQTSFLFTNSNLNDYQRENWILIQENYPEIIEYRDLEAPLGFIHAYDLTKLFINALINSDLDGDIKKVRNSIRESLKSIEGPIEGLIKTYREPFKDKNDALDKEDFRMGEYITERGIIISQ